MKNLSKKAVILNDLSSPYIQQAIIILKNNKDIREDTIIREAEEIVQAYFNKDYMYKPCENVKKEKGLKIIVLFLSIALASVLFYTFIR